jgi:hypothetical protein
MFLDKGRVNIVEDVGPNLADVCQDYYLVLVKSESQPTMNLLLALLDRSFNAEIAEEILISM